jgi:hypothetical protein
MRYALAGLLLAGGIGVAQAQDIPQITVTPRYDGGSAYVGPYGRDLPGVYMFSGGRTNPASPDLNTGGRPIPSMQKIPAEYTYSQSTLPILDSWHGTMGPGVIDF